MTDLPELFKHPAVRAATSAGTYTDNDGRTYRRGLDGWFHDYGTAEDGTKMVMIVRHDEMAEVIVAEAAKP